MPNDWYPRRIAELAEWHNNFAAQAALSGTTYGLTGGEVSQIGTDAALVLALFNYNETVDNFTESVTAHRRAFLNTTIGSPPPVSPTPPAAFSAPLGSLAAVEARTRGYANRIKASANYNASVGELYGIIPAEPTGPGVPQILQTTALIDADVALKIKTAGHTMIAVDMRRGGGDWTQIGATQTNTFIDTTNPLAEDGCEIREYRVQGMQGNNRIGEVSNIARIATMP